MAALADEPLIVIRDTREKKGQGWHYTGMIQNVLGCGDYSIQGMESNVCIERKGSVDEIFMNLGTKANKTRFMREIDRMQYFKYKYIIIEATLSQMWYGSKWSRVQPEYIIKQLQEIEIKYGVHVLFLEKGEAAEKYVGSLLEMIASLEKNKKVRLPQYEDYTK